MPDKIAIIGAGPGGYVAAIRAAQLGASVTVIDKDNVGGTCLHWGCIPSKYLRRAAELLEEIRHARSYGVQIAAPATLDVTQLMAGKQKVVDTQAKGIRKLLDHHGIEYLNGTASIADRHRLTVRQDATAEMEVTWDKLILATGTQPQPLPGVDFDAERVLSSDDVLHLKQLPESMLIVGGGVIGCEFAFILAAMGVEISVVEALSRALPLPSVDEACSKVLQREMKKRKIRFWPNTTVEEIEMLSQGVRVSLQPLAEDAPRRSPTTTQEVDQVLICIGRRPCSRGIGLEKLGLEMDDRGWIKTDRYMQTNVPGVYAIGDILGPEKIMLAHVASAEGVIAAENAMGAQQVMDYSAVPGAIFTMPEVANVGLTETQAQTAGIDYRSDSVLFRTLGKAQVIGALAGEAKIISARDSGRILGMHIIGPHATDLIAEATLAIRTGGTVQDLAETIHAHPTLPEIILETSLKALDRSLHG